MLAEYLNTRVARRLYALFVIVAFTPVVILGIYAYLEVSGYLIATSEDRLREESKSVGMDMLGQLTELSRELRAEGWRGEQPAPMTGTADRAAGSFLQIRRVPVDALGLTTQQRAQLQAGGAVLRTPSWERASLLLPLPEQAEALEGTLRPGALLPPFSLGLAYCLFETNGQRFGCSADAATPPPSLPAPLDRHSGTLSMDIGGEPFLAGHWQVPLSDSYAHDGLSVMSHIRKRDALAALAHFQRVFPAVLALALVMAVWLAMGQIRRQMRPLEALAGASMRIGRGDFDGRVSAGEGDEFADLARVFNSMAAGLQRKFKLLGSLAALDRMVLTNGAMDDIISTALSSLPGATSCEAAGVLVLREPAGQECGRLHYSLPSQNVSAASVVVPLDDENPALRKNNEPWIACPPAQLDAPFAGPFVDEGLRSIWLLPISVQGDTRAVLMLCYRVSPDHLEEALQAARSIADRLASAESNNLFEEELYRKEHFDTLTGLPNRSLLRDRVQEVLGIADRDHGSFALLLIDLDRFSELNESMGHGSGDAVLREIARRLLVHMNGLHTVAHLGADQFVVLVNEIKRGDEGDVLGRIADELLAVVAEPMTLGEREVDLCGTIGIAVHASSSGGFDTLLSHAEAAMRQAKRLRPGTYRFHSRELDGRAQERFERAQQLSRALGQEEFLLYYQPKVTAGSRRIVGAEALVRWQPEGQKLVSPGLFLPLIDELGLTTDLGAWVTETACRQLALWDRQGLQLPSISVNVAPRQFLEGDLLSCVRSALANSGLQPERLEVEILEETAFDESHVARAALDELRAMGVSIALDDFGTGYSSLSYLVDIPARVIKLDRSFVMNLTTDERQRGIVKAIIDLARRLDLEVVAEGVEDQEQWAQLHSMGCDIIQGFFFSPPVPADAFADMLRNEHVASATTA